jgi:putative peptidoglycan lipid II flippase
MKNKEWWLTFVKNGLLIAFSKVIGFLRDLVFAFYLGASKTADAFNFAYLMTGNIFILFGGLNGPFHSSVVTTLAKIQQTYSDLESEEQILRRQSRFLTFTFALTIGVFLILAALLYLLASPLLELLLSKQPKLIPETLLQTELMLPVFALTGIVGLLFGVASYKKRFFLPSLSPILSSLALIIFIALLYKIWGLSVLGLGTSLGAVFQMTVQFIDYFKAGFTIDFKFDVEEKSEFKTFLLILVPSLLSSSVGSLNVYVDGFFCAGLEEGSWTAILMANRLIQLPFGILLGSSLLSFLPRIVHLKDDKSGFFAAIYHEMKNLSALMVPMGILIAILSVPIVQVLFQRGEFGTQATKLVSVALFGLVFSLLTAIPREIYTRAFYAVGDSKTPMLVSCISIIWNALLDWLLAAKFQVMGIALSTSLTALINSALLVYLLHRKFDEKLKLKLQELFVDCVIFAITLLVGLMSLFFCNKYLNISSFVVLPWLDIVSIIKIASVSTPTLAIYFGLQLLKRKLRLGV